MNASACSTGRITAIGAVAGVVLTHALLGVFASGNSLVGLDLLFGGLVGAATTRKLSGRPVPRGLTAAIAWGGVLIGAAVVICVLVLSGWS